MCTLSKIFKRATFAFYSLSPNETKTNVVTFKCIAFSGLGADARVFNGLDLQAIPIQEIRWEKPLKGESIGDYAGRLSGQIQADSCVFLGLSFGGLMAMEVARHLNPAKVILLSSVKTRREIPFYYRAAGRLRLHKCLPTRWMMRSTAITHWFFGLKTKEEKALHRSILAQTDPVFFNWAVNALLTWQPQDCPCPVVHIHGSADRMLPLRFVQPHHVVSGAGHWMVMQQAAEVSALIQAELAGFMAQ